MLPLGQVRVGADTVDAWAGSIYSGFSEYTKEVRTTASGTPLAIVTPSTRVKVCTPTSKGGAVTVRHAGTLLLIYC